MEPETSGHTTTRPSIAGTLAIASSMASCRLSRTSCGTFAVSQLVIRRQQLIREDARAANLGGIAQTSRHHSHQRGIFEYAVADERIQVHARGLPRSIPGDAHPILIGERQRRQQRELEDPALQRRARQP